MRRRPCVGRLSNLGRAKKGIRFFLFLPVLLLVFASNSYSQTNSGTLVGEVMDSSGATVPNAKIIVTNTLTGVKSTTVTSGAGDYQILDLIPGTYSVRAEVAGFQPEVQTGVLIDVSRTTTVKMTLQVGSTTQQITVEATNAGVETETSTVATTVTEHLVEDLPLTNNNTQGGERDVLDLQFLTPGTEGSTWEGTVAGGQLFGGEILVDGASLDTVGGNSSDVINETPAIEGVQEFTVLSTGLSAEYGRSTNGILNFVTKGGTNQLHGSSYDIIRNTDFDANTWFNNFYSGENCVGSNNTAACKAGYATPSDKKNDYGVNLGGPVYIPHVYNGRDKTFFFYNWEQSRFASGGLNVITLPTAANRTGDFSANLTSNVVLASNPCDGGAPIYQGEIFNPATSQTIGGVTCRSHFANNVISTPLSKVAQNILNYIPLPNSSGLSDNFTKSFVNPVLGTFQTIRIDHSFQESDKVFWSFNTNEFAGYNGTLGIDTAADETTLQHFITHDMNAGWDHIFSPTLTNRVSVSYWKFSNILRTLGVLANKDWPSVLGIAGLNGAPFPVVNFEQGGYYDTGSAGVGEYFAAQNRISIDDHLSWVKGKHNLKFGYDLRAVQYSSWSSGISSGEFNFSNAETAGISSSITENGNAAASLMLGQMSAASAINILWYPRYSQYYNAVYAQDDFKVTRTLTVNLGLRWDVDRPYHAAGNRSSMFDPTLANPGAGGLPGAIAFAGSGKSDAWMPTAFTDFGPRIGFAWAPKMFHSKTAIRGAYDIIYGQLPSGDTDNDQTGFSLLSSYSDANSVGAFSGTPFTLDQGFPPLGTTVNTNPSQLNGEPVPYLNQGAKPSRVVQWDIQVQHEIAPDLGFSITYVGNHDTRLSSDLLYMNALPEKYWSLGSELTQPVVGNPYGIPVPYAGFTGTIANALRPYPQFLSINPTVESVGQSNYEALWVSLQRHFRSGLTFLGAYTWSKNTTDAGLWNGNPAPQNTFNISQEKALAVMNVPQNLSLSYAYEIPFGKGRHFLNNGSKAMDALIGGWIIGGIQNYASGSPITFGCANQIPGTDNCVRWNFTGSSLLSSAATSGNFNPAVDNYYLNPGESVHQAFVDPEANLAEGGGYKLGGLSQYTAARGYQAIGTSGLIESFSIAKQFPIVKESIRAEIRLELVNAFNRHEFQVPDSNPNDLAFGNVTASQISPRQLQLTGRIRF
ncbi:MAG: carboxypeptidase-like regulatory domain-containing protein [Terriglobia bacterium]